MLASTVSQFGDPATVLVLAERPLPEPGPGQVRVKLVLSPIHNHDLMLVWGRYGVKPELPFVPGTEALGVVDALGEGVTNLAIGQRVAGSVSAAWAEYFVANAAGLVPVPDSVDDATASQIVSMPISAYRLLYEMDLKAGDWIVLNAANGLVGKILNWLATEKGIHVINLVRRAEAVAELQALGIGNAIITEGDDWKSKALALTGGAPIKRAIDSIGGRAANDLMDLLGNEGWFISFGALSGKPLEFDAGAILFKQAVVKGFWAAKPSSIMTPEQIRAGIVDLVTRAAKGQLKLPYAKTFPLSAAGDAMRASAEAGRGAKIGLTAG
jgi:NADPH:quinone reductase-like Zn-dependent oxidoreductase